MGDQRAVFPKIGEGFWADAKTDKYHLRLFSSVTALGWVGAVYDMQGKAWVAREWADDSEDGKRRAEKIAEGIFGTLPTIDWKESS